MEVKYKMNGIKFKTDGIKVQSVTDISRTVDRAVRKKNSKGSIKLNPARRDCLGWYDKTKGQWVMAHDLTTEQKARL